MTNKEHLQRNQRNDLDESLVRAQQPIAEKLRKHNCTHALCRQHIIVSSRGAVV